jgi:hypothetical protein
MDELGFNLPTVIFVVLSFIILFVAPSCLNKIFATDGNSMVKENGQWKDQAMRLGWMARPIYIVSILIIYFSQYAQIAFYTLLFFMVIFLLYHYVPRIVRVIRDRMENTKKIMRD